MTKVSKVKALFTDSDGGTTSVDVLFCDENGYEYNPPRVILWKSGAARTPRSVEVTTRA